MYELQNVDESYHEFTGILEYTINMFCPRKINYYNNTKIKKKIWVNHETIKRSENLKDMFKISKVYPHLKELYKQKAKEQK